MTLKDKELIASLIVVLALWAIVFSALWAMFYFLSTLQIISCFAIYAMVGLFFDLISVTIRVFRA